jgi:hypothetical protein
MMKTIQPRMKNPAMIILDAMPPIQAQAVTRLSDRPDPVPDEIWNEVARHYDEPALAALILAIAVTNVFNRLNVTTRQVAGEAPWSGR